MLPNGNTVLKIDAKVVNIWHFTKFFSYFLYLCTQIIEFIWKLRKQNSR